jgi:RNA 3'-terminal phosphate cyclase (ATP)
MIEIDGSLGEGGGQVLRTSLALAAITGRAVRIDNVRARRSKPGLQRQHLACVLAAAEVCGGRVKGASIGSGRVDFEPGARRGGSYSFDIGTAGSTGLVLQTVLPILLHADGPSRVTIRGGTHNPLAPCADFLRATFLPMLARMGAAVSLEVGRHGFYPAGGGAIEVAIDPAALRGIEVLEAGPVTRRRARAIVARLPTHVAERELAVVRSRLGWDAADLEIVSVESAGPGNALLLEVVRDGVTEVVSAFGEKGTRAELVASRACDELERYFAHGAPIGEHLADQLLLPMTLARAGRFRTGPVSLHATTNIDVIRRFVDDVRFDVAAAGSTAEVSVQSAHA